jgi:hypothetical protein
MSKVIRWAAATGILLIGLLVLMFGTVLQLHQSRGRPFDVFPWCVLWLGVSLAAAGLSLPFARPRSIFFISALAPLATFLFAAFVVWLLKMVNVSFPLGL